MNKIYNISNKDFKNIEDSIYKNWLSYYNLDKNDFICYKEWELIIAYIRIFNIWENNYELSCLYVLEKFRGNYLWKEIIKDVIDEKFNLKNNLFLACKREMKQYYEKSWFAEIDKNIPEKLEHTLIWAKENNMDAIIMEFKN